MGDNRKYITINKDLFESEEELASFSDEELGRIFRNYFSTLVYGESTEVNPTERRVCKELFKEDAAALAVYERNSANGSKGGRPKNPPESDENPNESDLKATESKGEATESLMNKNNRNRIKNLELEPEEEERKETSKEKTGAKAPTSVFHKPTLLEVKEYCEERHNGIAPEQWYDFYEANGWKVGRNAMKDWKACIRSWERRRAEEQANRPKTQKEEMHELYLKALEEDAREEAERDKSGGSDINGSYTDLLPWK